MAKVWVVEVRVLWLHSAAWMALLLAEGEQPGVEGKEPLLLEVAGWRVAVARVKVRAKGRRVARNMVAFFVLMFGLV
jgi:hypothetical protein